MVKYCTKMEMKIKLNFTTINLICNVAVNVTRKWKEEIVLHLLFLSFFFSNHLGWISGFYFCKITFLITGHEPLILKIFNNKTDIILFLIQLLLLPYVILFTISYLIFLNYIFHLIYRLLFYFFHFHVNYEW